MRVLLTFAVEAEFAPWRKLRSFKKIRLSPDHWSGGVEVETTQIGECTVWVFLTGIGIKCLKPTVSASVGAAGVHLVVSSGLAGALKPELNLGEVLAFRRVGTLRDASGIGATTELVQMAEQCGAHLVDTLLTSNHIINTKEEKSRLALFADAVDMESFHVVQNFFLQKVPVAAIRAISDGSEEDLPLDFEKCLTADGQVKPIPLLKELVGRPGKIPELMRFGRRSKNAAEKLASFLDCYIQRLVPEALRSNASEVAV